MSDIENLCICHHPDYFHCGDGYSVNACSVCGCSCLNLELSIIGKKIDCTYTDEIVCPFCGCEYEDSYEFFNDDSVNTLIDLKCQECHKHFDVSREFNVNYTSTVPEKKP